MKKYIWCAASVLLLALLSACSGGAEPTAAPEEVEVKEVGTATPISNLPGEVENTPEPERGDFDAEELAKMLGDYILRPDDLPHPFRIPEGGEKRVANIGVIQRDGEVEGKHYIVSTGRVDGWWIALERKNKADVAPGGMEGTIEVFASSEGAELALSPDWFKAYKNEDKPLTEVNGGCNFGDECLFYYYQSLDPATNLTKLEYDIAFRYRNVLVTVLGRGLDIDMNPDYVLKAAEVVFKRLEQAS